MRQAVRSFTYLPICNAERLPKSRHLYTSTPLIERWLALLIGHRKCGFCYLFADLMHHGVNLAPRRQIVGTHLRRADQR
jgi:hypothetical protein